MTFLHIMLVGLGGFFGAIARYAISKQLNSSDQTIPKGTLIVNIVGAFLLGIITGAIANPILLLVCGTGFLGAFTTFSTIKLEMQTMRKKQLLVYSVATYGGGVLCAYIGYKIGALL